MWIDENPTTSKQGLKRGRFLDPEYPFQENQTGLMTIWKGERQGAENFCNPSMEGDSLPCSAGVGPGILFED